MEGISAELQEPQRDRIRTRGNVRAFFQVEGGLMGLRAVLNRLKSRISTRTAPPQNRSRAPAGSPTIKSPHEQLEGTLGALDAKPSEASAGFEPGSVPARETRYLGRRFVYPRDSAIGELIARGHEWDSVLHTLVAQLLPEEEPTICEVGSNIGASLLQILAAKPRARVISFEPSAHFRPFLERNLKLAGVDDVEVFPLLVGRKPGSMLLHQNSTTASAVNDTIEVVDGASLPPGFEPIGKELVEMTTLDEVFRDRGPVDFIKVDTDGFDFEVLRGAEATLKRDRPVLHFELEPRYLMELAPSAAIEGLAWLQSVGYRRFVCLSPIGQPIGTTDDPKQAIAWAEANVYCDVLTCPEESACEARLSTIKFG